MSNVRGQYQRTVKMFYSKEGRDRGRDTGRDGKDKMRHRGTDTGRGKVR